ncbi:MAG: adenylate/guanylate cyclase domain-containing protein, partial [Haliea sp.]
MSVTSTVVFADLTGSTGVFESLGNERATRAITKLTQWIGDVSQAHRGRVVKTLGDGVLAVFVEPADAVDAVVEMQRVHHQRIMEWPAKLRMQLQVGVACGEVVDVDGDCYGDAVNVASRLADLSGGDQIWATDTVIAQISGPNNGVRFRSLGAMNIRGKAESRVLYRIEWQEEVHTGLLTAPADLAELARPAGARVGAISLTWLDQNLNVTSDKCPVYLGRAPEAEFVINDQRVSRLHAGIAWRNGTFVLSDLSSFGTWVRFAGSQTEQALR